MRNLIIVLTLSLFMLTSAHAKILFSSIRDDNQGSNIYVSDNRAWKPLKQFILQIHITIVYNSHTETNMEVLS